MNPQSIKPRWWRVILFSLGRIVLPVLLVASGVAVAQVAVKALLSGGNAGIEGSILALGLCLTVGVYLLARAARKVNIMKSSRGRGGERANAAS
ncbi:MAG: hypothetical protein ACRDTR_11570 [Rubrobacter sp.]